MNPKTVARIAERLMRQPTAPYFEHAVRAEIERICDDNEIDWQRDKFGNVIVRLRTESKARPFILAAHMDHPGFEVRRARRNGELKARFQGGVPDRYFKPGLRVRLMPGSVPAKLGKRIGKAKEFHVVVNGKDASAAKFAMWDLEDFTLRNGRIYSRACDDLGGVATILAVMRELKRTRARVNVIGVLSRAEEVGFRGALALTDTRLLPKDSLVISLETSRELPGVKMGDGVILRVGDKTSVFDTEAMRFLAEVSTELKARSKSFRFQRALMSGGTCEATAYQEFGFQTGAVCVALGNYHNCAESNRIAAEYVDLNDVCSMTDLLVAAARAMPRYKALVSKLPKLLEKMRAEARRKLMREP
jgi:putative aminopeptidase FrvX